MIAKLKQAIKDLQKIKEFKDFKKKNPKSYLASCVVIVDGKNVGDWQMDYYQPKKHKMATFIIKDEIEFKGEDDIFQKEKAEVKELNLDEVKIGFDEVLKLLEDFRKEKYPGDFPNKTIAVLQVAEDYPIWNLTLLTSTLKVLNVKLSAVDGNVISDQIENFLNFKAS